MKKIKQIHITPTTFENESRLLKEAQSFLDSNYAPVVSVVSMMAPGLKPQETLPNGIKVNRYSHYIVRVLRKLRLLPGLWFRKSIVLSIALIILVRRPRIINIHHVSLIGLVRLKSFIPDLVVIYDTHELETESSRLDEKTKEYYKLIEAKWISRVDFTFVVSPSIKLWYQSTYPGLAVETVMNCPVRRKKSVLKDIFRTEFNIASDSLIFLYQGALFAGRGIETIISAFKLLNDPRYHVVFMGYGGLEEEIVELSKLNEQIHFYPAVNPAVLLDFTSSADFGISLIENTCLSYYYCMPNKVFEYLHAEIPVIVSNMKDMSEYVLKNKVGVVCQENTANDLIKSVLEISSLPMDTLKESILKTKNEFNWEIEEQKMIASYKLILDKVR